MIYLCCYISLVDTGCIIYRYSTTVGMKVEVPTDCPKMHSVHVTSSDDSNVNCLRTFVVILKDLMAKLQTVFVLLHYL